MFGQAAVALCSPEDVANVITASSRRIAERRCRSSLHGSLADQAILVAAE